MNVNADESAQARLGRLPTWQLRQLRERLGTPLTAVGAAPVKAAPRAFDLPQSFAQERLWFLHQMNPGGAAYNIAESISMQGRLDTAALQTSFAGLIQRHETLRTRFDYADGRPVQVIDRSEEFRLCVIDLSGLARQRQAQTVECLSGREMRQPFDLRAGAPFRVRLLRLAPAEHVLLLTMHHIVSDGWSMAIMLRDLSEIYRACSERRAAQLPALPVQYVDYALWQRQQLCGEALEREVSYWSRQLTGAPAVLALPADKPRPPVESSSGARVGFALPLALSTALRELSHREGTTLFMTLLAAFNILMARYSGQKDIVIGSTIAGRRWRELENLVGLFVNTLALRTDLSGNPSFRLLLARVKDVVLGALMHQDLPFERLVTELQPQRDLSLQPVFQVMFAMQNLPKPHTQATGVALARLSTDSPGAQFDLSVDVYDGPAISGVIEYATDLFEPATVERMAAHFVRLLEDVVSYPDSCIWELTLLTDPERLQLLAWSESAGEFPRDRLTHELFSARARQAPDAIAVAHDEEQFSYGELDLRADRLARQLRSFVTASETVIGICLEPSIEWLVGLLGIWKSAGVYLPLDPGHPPDRLTHMLREAGAKVLLSTSATPLAGFASELAVVSLDRDRDDNARGSADPPTLETWPENLAYVIFTSGSTGAPKGVAISHRSLTNKVVTLGERLGLRPGMRSALLSAVSVDAALEQICLPLVHGGCLVILDPLQRQAAVSFWEQVRSQQVQLLDCVPAFLEAVVETLPDSLPLEHLLVGGEKFTTELYRRVAGRTRARVTNIYGPTETTIDALAYEIIAPERSEIPIGTALRNYRCHVLDTWSNPVPIGVVGELCIGGVGLARGYVGCPAMTAQCFLPDPFRTGERLYRTGDRVRLRVDGNIEFIGRWDEQLKISGYRVEIGEIESVLRQQPYVRQAVVVPDPATDGTARLRAFVVADISRLAADPDCAAIAGIELPAHDPSILPRPWQERLGVFLKSRLRALLPAVMVPTTICVADELPLTSAGKVDRDALLARFVPLAAQVGYDAPVSQVQKALADIWSGLLQLERIGLNDDFFELGGHSLMAMRVVSRVEEELRIALPVRVLFEKSRLRDLSAHVESSLHGLQLAGNILPPGILKKLAGLTAQEAAELMQLLQTNG